MIGTSYYRRSTTTVVVGTVALLLNNPANGSLGVFGFTNARRQLLNPPSSTPMLTLNAATIDAAEVLDSSSSISDSGGVAPEKFFVGECDETDEDCRLFQALSASLDSTTADEDSIATRNEDTDKQTTARSVERMPNIMKVILPTIAILVTSTIFRTPLLQHLTAFSVWYMMCLDSYPLITKCITGGVVALLGDYGAQLFEYSSESSATATTTTKQKSSARKRMTLSDWDRRRGIARFLECLLISTPLMHMGYDYFEHILPIAGSSTATTSIYKCFATLSHIVADSVLLDGISVGTAIVFTGLLEGHSLRRYVLPNLRDVYLSTYLASVVTSAALLPIQFLSFRYLPVQLRVLSVNALDLVWTAVVSFVSHNGDVEDDKAFC
jgi:hypothetical protein